MQPLDFRSRPASALPVPFFALGLLGLLAVPAAAAIDPAVALQDQPSAAGLLFLHLITLGFLAPVMLGAYYQLVPVVLHAPIPRPAWGSAVLAALGAGALVFLLGWGLGQPAAVAGGGLLAGLGLCGFIVHAGAALARVRRPSPTAAAFAGALLALAAVAVLGPVLALRVDGLAPGAGDPLPAHAAAGLAGWVLLTVVGATYQLVPFFAATPPAVRPRFAYWAVALVAAGTALLALGAAGIGGGAVLAGLLLWTADLGQAARRGRQAGREPVVAYTVLAVALIVLAAAGAEADLLGAPVPVRVLALTGLLAGPALLVMGQLQKILPFLAALDASRQGHPPKTEQLFARETAFRLLPLAALGLLGMAAASALGSSVAVRLAALVAVLATAAHVARQLRAIGVWWRARGRP